MIDFIPRKTKLKNLKFTGANVYVLCCGELFDIIYSSDSIIDCIKYAKRFTSKFYDDIAIVPTFEEQH